WIGVGRSEDSDDHAAGRDAAVAALEGRDPSLVVIFSSPERDLGAVGAGARAVVGLGTRVVGCSTAGEIAGPVAAGGGVVAVGFGRGLMIRTALGDLADGPLAAGAAAAAGVVELDSPHRVLMLITEGLAGDRLAVLRGAYGVAGAAVPLVGGCAGDDFAMRQTWQLYDDQVLSGGVIGVAIGSDAPIGVGMGHGFRRIGEPMVVTRSRTDRVISLDDRPALDVYLDHMGAPAEAYEREGFLESVAMRHALGLERAGGEELRAVLGGDYQERSLTAADIPEGSMLWVMAGDPESVVAGTEIACEDALGRLEGRSPIGIVAFDCAGRRIILGESGMRDEMAVIAARAPGVPLGGFYTYGEIARVRGSRGVHSATLVLLAFS
ncbi:MAG: FIST N-terminal domain-containing protein, partial [Solirubrobacteraceae bacterium]